MNRFRTRSSYINWVKIQSSFDFKQIYGWHNDCIIIESLYLFL